MHSSTGSIFITLLAFFCTSDCFSNEIKIDFWYGDEQSFGHLGHPQKWVNILGEVSPTEDIHTLTYVLNNDVPKPLSFHEDNKRLAKDGDFNVEIDRFNLQKGLNTLTVTAKGNHGETVSKTVQINYVDDGNNWQIPYSIDWSKVKRIEEAVQVVDGKWKLTKDGIRTVERYYDRVLAFGDHTWENYEVTVSIIFHDLTSPKVDPNTTGVTHAAIATRWPGHTADGNQPSVQWYPLGATAEWRLGSDLTQCRWRIFDGKIMRKENRFYVEETRRRVIEFEKRYWMKHRVETLADGQSLYRVKFWEDGKTEPVLWDVHRTEPNDLQSGSALLLAHHSEVTFGNVIVIPVE